MDSNIDELKQKGNAAMKEEDYDTAVNLYGEAIALSPDNHVLYSNRSAAYMKLDKYQEALDDAEKTIDIKSDWAKGYSRKGSALFKLDRLQEAKDTYTAGLKVDPDSAMLKDGLSEVQAKQRVGERGEPSNFFADPSAEAKLRAHPKTRAYMQDPAFVATIKSLKGGADLMQHFRDSRVIEAMGVLMGVDLSTMTGGGGSDPFVHRPGKGPSSTDLTGEDSDSDEPMETGKPRSAAKKKEEDPVETENRKKKEQALEEKEKGNAAYKKKEFEVALAHYDKAFELDPSDITFLTNKAAVYSEQKEWDKCVEVCEEAVSKGRELRTDYKLIAKALARMGTAYFKQEKWDMAVKFFDKSLAEHRNPDIVKKKIEASKKMKELERLEYFDMDKSIEAKTEGNAFFKNCDFPNAVKCYTEAIKRNPDDAKLYSNRAACYQKLVEFPLALKDCEDCIKLDPKFVKGYIRKGHALLGLKDTMKALQAFHSAIDLDPNSSEAREGVAKCRSLVDDPEARRNAAMHDPEVQRILNDPAMQMILQQMQSQPESIRDHFKNPEIASMLQKLMDAGFISVR